MHTSTHPKTEVIKYKNAVYSNIELNLYGQKEKGLSKREEEGNKIRKRRSWRKEKRREREEGKEKMGEREGENKEIEGWSKHWYSQKWGIWYLLYQISLEWQTMQPGKKKIFILQNSFPL